jgi:hypothetical protein
MAKFIGICKLCLKEDFLCESHIIPEYFFKGMYDEKHRALELGTGPYEESYIRKGFYDRLLCVSCEAYLNSEFETYAIGVWQNQFPGEDHGIGYQLLGLDYMRFKLFHLSVLWRASVSKRDIFRNVNLGPHEEIIRKMILEKDPGRDDQYTFFGNFQTLEGNSLAYTAEPGPARTEDGHSIYVFDFGSCVWRYFVSSHPLGKVKDYCFNSKGRLLLPKTDIKNDRRLLRIIKAARNSPLYREGGKHHHLLNKTCSQ